MRYLMLCCFEEKQWNALPAAQRDSIMRDYGALMKRLDESGRHLGSAQLQPVANAATIRGRNGKATVTDGPFAETRVPNTMKRALRCHDFGSGREASRRQYVDIGKASDKAMGQNSCQPR